MEVKILLEAKAIKQHDKFQRRKEQKTEHNNKTAPPLLNTMFKHGQKWQSQTIRVIKSNRSLAHLTDCAAT